MTLSVAAMLSEKQNHHFMFFLIGHLRHEWQAYAEKGKLFFGLWPSDLNINLHQLCHLLLLETETITVNKSLTWSDEQMVSYLYQPASCIVKYSPTILRTDIIDPGTIVWLLVDNVTFINIYSRFSVYSRMHRLTLSAWGANVDG